jgi:hypothetical protein
VLQGGWQYSSLIICFTRIAEYARRNCTIIISLCLYRNQKVLPFWGLRLTRNCFRRLAISLNNYDISGLTCTQDETRTETQSSDALQLPTSFVSRRYKTDELAGPQRARQGGRDRAQCVWGWEGVTLVSSITGKGSYCGGRGMDHVPRLPHVS